MIDELILESTENLETAGIETARLDVLVLLEDVVGKNRAHLLAHPELKLTNKQQEQLKSFLKRRLTHEPLAYIRGKAEFYGREFIVNDRVLVPRPESEDIVELLGDYGQVSTIIDVGTGSGALAISAKLARPGADVVAVDIDTVCLEVGRLNAKNLHAGVVFLEGDLLRNIDLRAYRSPVYVLANLPYVPDGYEINDTAKHEPGLALFGGKDGLDLYRVMFDQLREYDDIEIIVLTESLESQHTSLKGIAFDCGFIETGTKGLIQTFAYTP